MWNALKHAKQKMHVYSKQTVMLKGVLDEEGYLEEGEVLVRDAAHRSTCLHVHNITLMLFLPVSAYLAV